MFDMQRLRWRCPSGKGAGRPLLGGDIARVFADVTHQEGAVGHGEAHQHDQPGRAVRSSPNAAIRESSRRKKH